MPVSFDDITGAWLGSYSGRQPPTPQANVLNMMSRLGDMATLCASNDNLSTFEAAEVSTLIGELAVALCGLGASLDVDVGIAAANVARRRCVDASTRRKRDTLRPSDAHSPSNAAAATGGTTTPGSNSSSARGRPPPLAVPGESPKAVTQPAQRREASGGESAAEQSQHLPLTHTGSLAVSAMTESASPASRARTAVDTEGDERGRWAQHHRSQPQQQQQQQQPPPPQRHSQNQSLGGADELLSPRTTAAFFPELDKIVALFRAGQLSKSEFESLEMVYSVIDDHGAVIDLIPDGRFKAVDFADFMTYVRMAEPLRHHAPPLRLLNPQQHHHHQQQGHHGHGHHQNGHHHQQQQQQQQQQPQGGGGGFDELRSPRGATGREPDGSDFGLTSPSVGPMRNPPQQQNAPLAGSPPLVHRSSAEAAGGNGHFETRRLPVDTRPDPRQHGNFSPDHFVGGVFSPHAERTHVDVEYFVDSRSPQGPRGHGDGGEGGQGGGRGGSHHVAFSPARHQEPTQQTQTTSDSGSPGGPLHRSMDQAPAAATPTRQLTAQEEETFWKKVAIIEAREATGNGIAALGLTLTMPEKGRLVPLTTNGEYLPVTAANAEDFLTLIRDQQQLRSGKLRRVDSVKALAMPNPPSFNWKKEAKQYGTERRTDSGNQLMAPAPPHRTVFYVDFDERAVGEVEPPALRRKAIPPMFPSSSHYMDFIMTNPESFKDVVNAASRDRNMLTRLQVTYCVPDPNALLSPHMVASLPAGARPRCGLTDLVENGRNIRVQPADWERYYGLVMQASRSLPPSVAVPKQ